MIVPATHGVINGGIYPNAERYAYGSSWFGAFFRLNGAGFLYLPRTA